jgi:hypothetical protein
MIIGITEIGAWYIVLATKTTTINKKLRMYPEVRRVPKASDALLLGSVDILIEPNSM